DRKALANSKKDSTAKADVNWIAGDTIVARWAQVTDSAGPAKTKLRHLQAHGSARSFSHLYNERDSTRGPSMDYSRGQVINIALRGDQIERIVVSGRAAGPHPGPAPARHRLSRRVSEVAGLRQGIEPPRGRQSLGGRCPHPPPDLGVAATRRPEDPGGAGGRPVERRAGGVHPGGVARDPRRPRARGGAAPGSGRAGGDAGRDGGRAPPDHRGEPARDVQPGEGLQEPAGGKRR